MPYTDNPDEFRERFREIFSALRTPQSKPRTLKRNFPAQASAAEMVRLAAPSQKPASATPDKKSLSFNKESTK
jgi:hypothetical protein